MPKSPIEALSLMIGNLKGVTVGKHLNNKNFLTRGRVFAFMKGDGIALKLPKEKIAQIIKDKDIKPLIMGKRKMNEWVVIERKTTREYKKDLPLFRESIEFVSKTRMDKK